MKSEGLIVLWVKVSLHEKFQNAERNAELKRVINCKNYYRDKGNLEWRKEALPFDFRSRCQLSECHVKAIVVISVAEVVDVVSLNSILAIVNSSLPCSLSSSSEISFQRRCPCVQNTNAVSVVSPGLTECLLKRSVKLLKWIASRLSSDVHFP